MVEPHKVSTVISTVIKIGIIILLCMVKHA